MTIENLLRDFTEDALALESFGPGTENRTLPETKIVDSGRQQEGLVNPQVPQVQKTESLKPEIFNELI